LHQQIGIFDEIRRGAFDLFEQRGRENGKDIDDWLNALRQFLMPNQIDPDQVSASLQEGIVTIVANKAAAVLPKPVASEPAVQQKGKTSAV